MSRVPTAADPCRYPAPDCGCEYCAQQAEMDTEHVDQGGCCECGGPHNCQDCPTFTEEKAQ